MAFDFSPKKFNFKICQKTKKIPYVTLSKVLTKISYHFSSGICNSKIEAKKKKEIPLNFVSILNYFFVEKNKKECKRIKSDENAFTYDTYVYEKYK